ncbi:MAG TPA: DoxX family protein [Bryobacteraceae bacterium]|nr:DoxX family protein [Bryobacteraceae bacterium]
MPGYTDNLVDVDGRIAWIKWVVSLALIAGLLLSYKLWMSSRSYPSTPVWHGLKSPSDVFDYIVYIGILLCAAFAAILRRPTLPLAVGVALIAVACFFDQSRLQPWVFQYALLTIALARYSNSNREQRDQVSLLNICRLIVAAIYFWSGLQKLNHGFADDVFPAMLKPLVQMFPSAGGAVQNLGGLAAFAESAMGLGLLFRSTQRVSVICAVGMHVFIVASLGPFDQNFNSVIWPWNILMIILDILLFWKTSDFSVEDVLTIRRGPFHVVVLLVVGVAPVLSFFGAWDNYLSWALYSGNKTSAHLYISDAVYEKLPSNVQDYVYEDESGQNDLNIMNWSYGELNVPSYPEARVYSNVAGSLCQYALVPSEIRLVVKRRDTLLGKGVVSEYDCSNLRIR